MKFSKFADRNLKPFKPWANFFLELGYFSSHYASSRSSDGERLSITITVPGAEFASTFLALGANIQAITSDKDLYTESSLVKFNHDNLAYNDEVIMKFERKNKPSKGYFKGKFKKEGYFLFSETNAATSDNRFEKVLIEDLSKRVFRPGTSADLIELSPLLQACCKGINFNLMLEKEECVTTLLGIKNATFDESEENLVFLDGDSWVGGNFNEIARFQNDSKKATGYYSRVYSNFRGASIHNFMQETNDRETRLLLLTSKSLNSLPLGAKTNEKVRINLLDRSKNIVSLVESLQKIEREKQALGGKNLDPNNFLNFKIPSSMEVATQIIYL